MKETEELRKIHNPDGSELRTMQLKMLDILIVIRDICDKYNIPYWLSGGTLLGAVVHGGFIPWDDDIDIELMRADYKKLLKILAKELPAHLYLQTPKDKGYPVLFSKVRDKNSIVHSKDEDEASYKEKGFFVDIAPQERSYMPIKKFLDNIYGRSFRRIKRGKALHSWQYFYEYTISLFLYPIGLVCMGLARLFCKIAKPDTVVYGYGINAAHSQNISDLLPTSPIMFEGLEFAAPNKPHEYLVSQYKCDYTQIPPIDKRPTHFTNVEYI